MTENDWVLWELVGFTQDLKRMKETIERFNFLEPKAHKILVNLVNSTLIKYKDKVEKRRKRKST